jgi:hypothetical protein
MKLSIRATILSSALTTLIMALLLIPIHMLRMHAMMTGMMPGQRAMHAHMGGPMLVGLLIFLVALVVYAGVGGFIFAAIYNVFAPKQHV